MLEMVMVARGLPSRASKKAWQNDDKREAGAVFSRPFGNQDRLGLGFREGLGFSAKDPSS